MISLKHKRDHIFPRPKPLITYCPAIALGMASRPCMSWPLRTCPASPWVPLTLSSHHPGLPPPPQIPKLLPTSRPLHTLFSLPGLLFPLATCPASHRSQLKCHFPEKPSLTTLSWEPSPPLLNGTGPNQSPCILGRACFRPRRAGTAH